MITELRRDSNNREGNKTVETSENKKMIIWVDENKEAFPPYLNFLERLTLKVRAKSRGIPPALLGFNECNENPYINQIYTETIFSLFATEDNMSSIRDTFLGIEADLIILNLFLPKGGIYTELRADPVGLQCLREIRQEGMNIQTPVMIYAGSQHYKNFCLDAGANAYLTNHTHSTEFQDTIDALLRKNVL